MDLHPALKYTIAGSVLLAVLAIVGAMNDPAPAPPAPAPAQVEPKPPVIEDEPETEDEPEVEPLTHGEEVGKITRETFGELYEFGEDFVDGFTDDNLNE